MGKLLCRDEHGFGAKLRIVFVGASHFGARCLEAVAQSDSYEVVGVVTAPRQFKISYAPKGVTNALYADMSAFSLEKGIPVATLKSSMNDELLFEQVSRWKPDIMLIVGWYHMIPKRWRDLAPAFGLHASLLPDYSGGAPLVWAIINGEKRTGITLFQMDGGVDSGPVVAQRECTIRDDDTIATLYSRIEDLGLNMLLEQLPLLANGKAKFKVQDERMRRLVPQRSPEDGRIDWTRSVTEVRNFVRAQTRPYPGAFVGDEGNRVHIWATEIGRPAPVLPGQAILAEDNVVVGCGREGTVIVTDATRNGRKLEGAALIKALNSFRDKND